MWINRCIKSYVYYKAYTNIIYIPRYILLVVFSLQCLCIISSIDFTSFLININYINQLDSSIHDGSYNTVYDPVREAAAQNTATGSFNDQGSSSGGGGGPSSGGGPSEPQGDLNSSSNKDRITDTSRLGNYLTDKCGDGGAMENYMNPTPNHLLTTPDRVYCSRIWAHVKSEHPEWTNNYPWDSSVTVNDSTLRSNIYSLNKNYPGRWP